MPKGQYSRPRASSERQEMTRRASAIAEDLSKYYDKTGNVKSKKAMQGVQNRMRTRERSGFVRNFVGAPR